jgi:hypothetical protein
MNRTAGTTALVAAGLWLAAAGPATAAGRLNQAKVDQDVAAAREALNEVASRLGIGNADAARFALGEAWRVVGRVRGAYGELSRLRLLVTQLGSGQVLTAQQTGHLDKIQLELDKLAKQYRMPVAYDRLAAAREARDKRQTVVMRREAHAVLDAAVSAMSRRSGARVGRGPPRGRGRAGLADVVGGPGGGRRRRHNPSRP